MSGRGRRGHGEGSVFQRPNGMWVAQVDLGWIGGRRRRRTVYGSTEREVLAKRDQLRSQLARGVNLADPPRTVEQWLNEWLTDRQGRRRDKPVDSRARYDQIVRVHLIPLVGRIKLSALTPRDVQLMVSQLRRNCSSGIGHQDSRRAAQCSERRRADGPGPPQCGEEQFVPQR